MRIHELKCWPEPFEAVSHGRKPFEYRRDDRGFAVDDTLWLREWDPSGSALSSAVNGTIVLGGRYTGREMKRRVTYILRGFGVPDGYVVMGLVGAAP